MLQCLWVRDLINILLSHELVEVIVWEHGAVVGVVHDQTETALRREVAELLVQTGVGEEAFQLVQIDIGITALPGVKHLEIRPIVLWQHTTIFLLQFAQLGSTLWIGLQLCFDLLADILGDVEVVAQRTLLDVVTILVIVLIDVLLHLDQRRWVGRDEDGGIDLDRETHDGVVAGIVILDAIHATRHGIHLFDKRRRIATGHTRHRTSHGTVWSISLDILTDDGDQLAIEGLRAVHDVVIEPHLGHLAIDRLEIDVGDGNPFRLLGSTRCSGIHHWLTGHQHIGLTVLVSVNVRTVILIVAGGNLFRITFVEFLSVFGFQDIGKTVLTTEFRILAILQDGA